MRMPGDQLEPDDRAEAGAEDAGAMGGDGNQDPRHVVGMRRDGDRLAGVGDRAARLAAPIAGDHGEPVEQRRDAAEDVGVAVSRRQQEQRRAVAGHLVVDRRADHLDLALTDLGHGVLEPPPGL